MAAAVWHFKRSRGSGSIHDSKRELAMHRSGTAGLERLVWTVRGEAAKPLEPQPLGNEATGWLVSDDGRPKLSG